MARRGLSKHRYEGFSLVELTIALAIFSTGLGGFSLLLMLAIQESSASHLKSIAAIEAASLADSLRLAPDAVDGALPYAAAGNCPAGSFCTAQQMASSALHDWQEGLARRIPGSAGVLCFDSTPDDGQVGAPACDGAGGAVVKVFWSEPGRKEYKSGQQRRQVALLPLL